MPFSCQVVFQPIHKASTDLLYFCFSRISYSYFMSFVSGFFYLLLCFWYSSTLFCISSVLFYLLNCILLNAHATFCLYIGQLMAICVISIWLLWIMLLWTFMYTFLHGHIFSFLLGKHLGVALLDHVVGVMFPLLRH